MKKLILYAALPTLFVACNKVEGPGGTSSVTGKITGQDFEPSVHEITEIVFTPGTEVEHGDYFVLNTPVGGTYYYVYYKNPGWISDPDPGLSGRVGIEVVFNYSDSNIQLADNTGDAILGAASSDFDIVRENDVLVITNKTAGYVPDANKMITNFEFNIADQGEDQLLTTSAAAADVRVYIQYGDDTIYGDETRTGGDGEFRFTNLVEGTYTVYAMSEVMTAPGTFEKKSVTVTISDKKSTVDAGSLEIVY